MANVPHSSRTDPDLHEPKGYAEASAGTLYLADGAGSGSFTRPLVLISSGTISATAETDITGLSDYRELIFIVENGQIRDSDRLNLQLYGDTTGAFLSNSSDYEHTMISTSEDEDEDNINVEGLFIGRGAGNGRIYLQSITRISNFNVAGQRTRSVAWTTSVNAYHPSSSTLPTQQQGRIFHSQTVAAQVHSQIKIRVVGGGTVLDLKYSLWGFR